MHRYIPESDIQNAAQDVLKSYENKYGNISQFVPVDNIVEHHLRIHLEVFDNERLPPKYHGDVLGFIDLKTNCIGIHESILPEKSKSEGRYNFTLSHEVGHYVLHKEQILQNAAQLSCFELPPPRFLAKTEDNNSVIERQADWFASHLLMPDSLIQKYWHDLTGGYLPITYKSIAKTFSPVANMRHKKESLAEIFCKGMAEKLKVSPRALFIRLKRMGLIVEHEQLRLRV